jgi:uncharacterized membrane protein YdbT with pleckstrin-like domain
MIERLHPWLLKLLRVPAEPAPPPGDPRVLQTFRASTNYYRYSVATWILKQLSAGSALLFSYFFFRTFVMPRGVGGWFGFVEQLAIAGFLLQLPFSYALLRLDFQMRWYILSDRSLRIRSGILSVHEQTMAFANVQNITVRQNPLQRLFGIYTVAVRAAGGGGGGTQGKSSGGTSSSHEATFEGVSNAEEIRTLIRERVRQHRDSGLGDPDEQHREVPPGRMAAGMAGAGGRRTASAAGGAAVAEAAAAARLLQREAAALRAAAFG